MGRRRPLKPLERASRRILARMLVGRPGRVSACEPPEPRSVLVVRPDSRLGNLVLVLPLLDGLRRRFPDARVTLLASDRFAVLPAGQGYDVLPVAKARMASHPWLFPGFAGRLRGFGFDCAIDASHPFSFSLSGAVACRLSGAGTRIGSETGGQEGWYTHLVSGMSPGDHESRTLHRLGSLWTGWPGFSRPALKPRVASSPGGIGLHVGASRGKFIPREMLAGIVAGLCRMGRVTLFWSGPEEHATAAGLAGPGAAVSPALDIDGLLSAFSGLDILVTADNGPMHVASALGVPVLALFRFPNQARFGPLSEGSRVLYDPGGPPVEMVLETARAMLTGSGRG